MATFQLKVHETQNISTFAGRFSNGSINKDASDIRLGLLESDTVDGKGRKRNMVVAETSAMTYIGHSSGMYAPAAHCKYMVGVLNRRKGKMKVYDTRLYNFRPEALVEEKDDVEDEKDDAEKEKTARSMMDELTSAFGSRRKKQAMTSRIKNQLQDDVLRAAVSTAVQHSNIDVTAAAAAQQAATQEAAGGIPPHDKNAERPQDVYKLSDLMSREAVQALEPAAQALATADAQALEAMAQEYKFSEYVSHQLSVLPLREAARVHKCCQLLYLHYMICLFNMKVAALKAKTPLVDLRAPALVEKELLGKFTLAAPGGRRVVPNRCKDTLVSYILAVCLNLDEFELNSYRLQKDLRLGINKMRMFLGALGCACKMVTTADASTGLTSRCVTATLPLPLKFPDLSKRKPKSRS